MKEKQEMNKANIDQLDIFEPRSHRRSSDPDTSHAAASDPRLAVSAKTLMGKVLQAYKVNGPMTTFEAADAMGIDHQRVWKRCSDLLNKRLLRDTGDRRLSPSNRYVMVLEVAP